MTLRFAYQKFRTRRPLPSLRGRTERPRPIVPVSLVGPGGAVARDALLDTGADDTVFPLSAAAALGIDLSNAPTGSGSGAGLAALTFQYAEVTIRIASPSEFREWSGWVGFTSGQLRQPILGFAGFLEFFTASFHGDGEFVDLTVNGNYAGS